MNTQLIFLIRIFSIQLLSINSINSKSKINKIIMYCIVHNVIIRNRKLHRHNKWLAVNCFTRPSIDVKIWNGINIICWKTFANQKKKTLYAAKEQNVKSNSRSFKIFYSLGHSFFVPRFLNGLKMKIGYLFLKNKLLNRCNMQYYKRHIFNRPYCLLNWKTYKVWCVDVLVRLLYRSNRDRLILHVCSIS